MILLRFVKRLERAICSLFINWDFQVEQGRAAGGPGRQSGCTLPLRKRCGRVRLLARQSRTFGRGGHTVQLRLSKRTAGGVMVVDCSGTLVFGEESAALRDMDKK